jgi:hypothetical protein
MWYTPYLMRHTCQPPRSLNVPEWVREPALGSDAAVVAFLRRIDLKHRCRRELGIGIRDHSALAVTDRELLVITRRGARTRVAARYPRVAAHVIDFRTLPLGGDFLVDRLVIRVGEVAIRADFDGRLHREAEGVVAALGGVPAH